MTPEYTVQQEVVYPGGNEWSDLECATFDDVDDAIRSCDSYNRNHPSLRFRVAMTVVIVVYTPSLLSSKDGE